MSHATLPTCVDLRPRLDAWGLGPRRQGKRPTCSVFAVTAALEYALAEARGHGERLSIEFLNWAGHQRGRTDDGGFFHELWDGFERFGICPETVLPYREAFDPVLVPERAALDAAAASNAVGLRLHWIKEWNPGTGLTSAGFEAVRQTLAAGRPVCGGLRWPKQSRWEAGVLQMCGPDEVYDGHSVLFAGYDDAAEVFHVRNSAGEGRDGALCYEYVRAYTNDAASVVLATVRPRRRTSCLGCCLPPYGGETSVAG